VVVELVGEMKMASDLILSCPGTACMDLDSREKFKILVWVLNF